MSIGVIVAVILHGALFARALQRVLQQRYPPMLREAGIGGTVTLVVFTVR